MANYLRTMMLISSVMCLWAPASEAQMIDPTKPPDVLPNVKLGAFELSAISISPASKYAVINGNIVHVGDQVNSVKVINIENNSVELEGITGKLTLTLLTSPKK